MRTRVVSRSTRRLAMLSIIFGAALFDRVEAATELEERDTIETNVLHLLSTEDFRALEELSRSYRTTRSRTSSGLWHLTLFYAGIDRAIRQASDDAAFADLEGKVKRWTGAFPESPSAHIVQGMVLVAGERTAPGRAYLEEHKGIAAVDPQWYEVMVGVARVEGWDYFEFSDLLDEAFAREPLFYETYFRAMEYLLPKWYGSAREIEALARTAAQRTSAEEGDGLYARIYWYASQAEYGKNLFSHSMVDWPLMRDGFEDVIAKYPDAWNMNNFAKFSCLARDKETTVALFDRIEDDIVPEAWRPSSLFTECSFWLLLP